MRLGYLPSVLLLLEGAYSHPWDLKNFKSLVSFGDSYTDRARLNYINSHNGTLPPVGWVEPDNNNTASGGYGWLHYVGAESGANLYNYAVSAGACSNKITPLVMRGFLLPTVLEYEIPAYHADKEYTTPSGEKFLNVPADETVYAMWIGTNDLTQGAFLFDAQVEGKTIPDYIKCVYESFDELYANGARYFVLMNIAPLQLAPLYATPEHNGVQGENWAWPDKPDNITMVSYKMWQEASMVNYAFQYQTPYEMLVKGRYPDARFAIMDMNGLITDIYNNPTEYLEAPANVTGYINHCNLDMSECHRLGNPESFLWFDYSHPSQRTDEIIAKTFVDVVNGDSKWATYW